VGERESKEAGVKGRTYIDFDCKRLAFVLVISQRLGEQDHAPLATGKRMRVWLSNGFRANKLELLVEDWVGLKQIEYLGFGAALLLQGGGRVWCSLSWDWKRGRGGEMVGYQHTRAIDKIWILFLFFRFFSAFLFLWFWRRFSRLWFGFACCLLGWRR